VPLLGAAKVLALELRPPPAGRPPKPRRRLQTYFQRR